MMELRILSPVRTVVEATVSSVTLPGSVSPFQVLDGHAPMITSLEAGKISYVVQGRTESVVISSGYAMIDNGKVTVCVEE